MKAHILTIGDEILIGQIVDTNSAWIARKLNDAGITVESKLSVGDTRRAILDAVSDAMQRCEAVIITGGLGPTKDDITKHTLAEYFGCPLVRHEPTYNAVRDMLAARGIDFNELNRGQATVPACCTVLPNRNGTAPGMWFERNGRVLVSLPGVPFEMKALMEESVMPRLRDHFRLQAVVHKTAITFGLAESVLAATIAPWEASLPEWLHLAYLPSPCQIRLRLSAYDVEADVALAEIDRRFAELEQLIPAYLVGYGNDTVFSAAATLLKDAGATLAVAESCTGGTVSAGFTAMPGASAYFRGGVVAYANDVKRNVLGVDGEVLGRLGAVSGPVAEQMAEGVRRTCGADYGIATTGIAGPDGGTPEKPVGTVWIAVAGPDGAVSRRMVYGRLRQQNIDRAAAAAANMLRLVLLGRSDVVLNQGVL